MRDWDNRGRHTSVNRQLVLLPQGGILIDTPGMRELQLWETGQSIDETFADILALAEDCRFRDCRHGAEPGCAVLAAQEAGSLPPERLASFHKLAAEQAFQHRQQDARARIEEKRQTRIMTKSANKWLKEKRK